jgi:recombination protein RecA
MAMLSPPNLRTAVTYSNRWNLSEIAGRLVEISGSNATSTLTVTFGLVLDAQEHGEPVGWTTSLESLFYPPDVARLGIDLAALVIVRVPRPDSIARAGEKLLRSGGFGLVVLDLGVTDIPMPLQTRLTGLAHHHHAALVCISVKDTQTFSLGSLVSLRVHAERKRIGKDEFASGLRVVKDKRRGPTWTHEELHCGPPGLHSFVM